MYKKFIEPIWFWFKKWARKIKKAWKWYTDWLFSWQK